VRVCAPQKARGRSRSGFFNSLLDPKTRLALRDERALASFDEIESFVIEVYANREIGDTFRLILGRVGKCDIFIGDTKDQFHCSRLAARMSTLTGKPVVTRRTMV
jgi:hypothetical protein